MVESNIKIVLTVGGFIVFSGLFLFLDLGSLFSFDVALDATSSGGRASQRGVDASTGHFRGEGFGNRGMPVGEDSVGDDTTVDTSNPSNVEIIDSRTGEPIVVEIDSVQTGDGGAPASTFATLGGFQDEIMREEAVAFPSIHTPAHGQTISASILIQWKGENPLIVQQVVFGEQIRNHVNFDLPQMVFDTDRNQDDEGFYEGEFVYEITLPQNFPSETIVPVSLMVDTGFFTQIVGTEIELSEPQGIVKTFSLAEFFRSLLLLIRIGN